MILTDREIRLEWESGNIRFDPDIELDQIGDSSVDLRLARPLRIPERDPNINIRPSGRIPQELYGKPLDMEDAGYNLVSQKFVLGSTYEKVVLPNYLVGRLEGKSSLARLGLMIHCTSAHIDPGFRAVIVLEMYNHGPNTIVLEPMMPIAHIVFAKVSLPPSKSYSGQFADQISA